MARGVNKVILVGNLGADPEGRVMQSGKKTCNLSIATSKSWTDAEGKKQEKTEWHRAVIYDRLAEIAIQYLSKGSKVYVEGELRTRRWPRGDGTDNFITEVVVSVLQMLDGRPNHGTPVNYGDIPF